MPSSLLLSASAPHDHPAMTQTRRSGPGAGRSENGYGRRWGRRFILAFLFFNREFTHFTSWQLDHLAYPSCSCATLDLVICTSIFVAGKEQSRILLPSNPTADITQPDPSLRPILLKDLPLEILDQRFNQRISRVQSLRPKHSTNTCLSIDKLLFTHT